MRLQPILFLCLTTLLGAQASTASADITPMTETIPEQKSVSITCALPQTDIAMLGEKMNLPAAEYHYLVWLPPDYHKFANRAYPCLFISMPGGHAKPAAFTDRLSRDQWIAVCLTEAHNGAWEPVAANFLAAHDDAVKRFRIAQGFKFMTGVSGGARSSAACTSLRPGFAGVFLQAAGFAVKAPKVYDTKTLQLNPGLNIYGVFGIADPNRLEAQQMEIQMPKGTIQRFSLANGGHDSASPSSIDDALDYLEDQTYTKREFDDKAGHDQYALRFTLLLDRAKSSQGLPKFEALEEAAKIAEARKLSNDKTLTADVAETEKLLKTLPTDPALTRELAARTAYRQVRDDEDAGWVPLGTKTPELSDFVKAAGAKYTDIATKFDGTIYAKKAADRAQWLLKGANDTDPNLLKGK